MWTKISSFFAAFILAIVLSAISVPDKAWAVVCANDPAAPNNGTPYADPATDGGSAQSTACGDGSNAGGDNTGHNTAVGVGSNAFGTDDAVNTAIGAGANASGNGGFNTATGALSNASGFEGHNLLSASTARRTAISAPIPRLGRAPTPAAVMASISQ